MSSISRLLHRHFCTAITTTTTAATTATSSSPTMKSIIDKLFKERNLNKLVESFKQCSETYRFRAKHRVYQVTVRRLASAKRFASVEEILEDQKRYHDIRREGFAIRIISLYGKAGMADHAYKTFNQLPDLKCERTVKSFNAVLGAYVDSSKYDEVEKLFREVPEKLGVKPDEYSYTIAIQALCATRELDSALELLGEMEKNGLKPNLVTFNTLLNGFYENGKFLEGERIWAKMEKKDIVPDIRSYNARLKGLVHVGRISEAVKLIEEMKNEELKADTFSYNALIKGFCKDGKLDDAKKVYDELLKNECVENRWTYETLIPDLCENGDFEFALNLCRKSIGSNCYIDAGLVQGVVDGLVKQSKVEDAKKLVELARFKSYGRSSLTMPSDDE